MDTSARRCFLEVYVAGFAEPRLLQLEPSVKFHNVVERFDEAGDLYWGEQRLDPEATPAALGMPCGVAAANELWFVPATPSPSMPPPQPGGPSLPARFDLATAPMPPPAAQQPQQQQQRLGRASIAVVGAQGGATAAPASWYSRPRLLSPALPTPPRHVSADPPPPPSLPTARAATAAASVPSRRGRERTPEVSVDVSPIAPHAVAPVRHRHYAAPLPAPTSRRNAPILMDPSLLVDEAAADVALEAELRRLRSELQRLRNRDATPVRREVVVRVPSVGVAGVEELAMDLHDRQMHRLYEQRRLYLTHDTTA